MNPFETLMCEHRFLEQLLEALEDCVDLEHEESDRLAQDVRKFAEVLSAFNRLWHQAKEESLLFPLMRAQQVGTGALLPAIASEHSDERTMVEALASTHSNEDPERTLATVHAYTDHARCHIYTEETLLFPLARSKLTPASIEELSRALAEFDQQLFATPEHQQMMVQAQELKARYPTQAACIQPRVAWDGSEE